MNNEIEFSFVTEIYGVSILVNPDILSIELGILHVQELEAAYPIAHLSTDNRAKFATRMRSKKVDWKGSLDASTYHLSTRLLYHVFTYSLIPTTHQANMSQEMA